MASIKDAMTYFGKREGESLKEFAAEWKSLTDDDKAQILGGLEDGSLTY